MLARGSEPDGVTGGDYGGEVDSFEALAVTILALLPGALFTWSFEREVGDRGAGLADRVYRFVGFSAIFHAALAYPEYLFWTNASGYPEPQDS
jgi:hypothetical protein